MLGLSLFLTFFVMAPTFSQMNADAVQPYLSNKMDFNTAVDRGEIPLRRFMVAQTYKDDLKLFLQMSHTPMPKITDPAHPADVLPMQVVIPAFVISELKTGFIFGFIIYIPFIIIDLVVSSLLMSMGMMMLPADGDFPACQDSGLHPRGWLARHRRVSGGELPDIES